MEYEDLIKDGKLEDALTSLQNQIRKKPADKDLRLLLFQLLCAIGSLERAAKQLDVLEDMSGDMKMLTQLYSQILACEKERIAVFEGTKNPMIFGEPENWVASLVKGTQCAGEGNFKAAAELTSKAFDEAPATAGTIDGKEFAWVADMDSRLGPVMEVMMNGNYYWISCSNIKSISIREPEHLIDFIWIAADVTFANGTPMSAIIPVRYCGTEKASNGALSLSKQTSWEEPEAGYYLGLGQRMFSTDQEEYAILDIRNIEFKTE